MTTLRYIYGNSIRKVPGDRFGDLLRRLIPITHSDNQAIIEWCLEYAYRSGYKVYFHDTLEFVDYIHEHPAVISDGWEDRIDFQWDGHGSMFIDSRPEHADAAREFLHETVHHICASKQQRLVPEYGLGGGPGTRDHERADRYRIGDAKWRLAQESKVCLMSGLIAAQLGCDPFLEWKWVNVGERSNTYPNAPKNAPISFYHWNGEPSLLGTLDELVAEKFLDQQYRPTRKVMRG